VFVGGVVAGWAVGKAGGGELWEVLAVRFPTSQIARTAGAPGGDAPTLVDPPTVFGSGEEVTHRYVFNGLDPEGSVAKSLPASSVQVDDFLNVVSAVETEGVVIRQAVWANNDLFGSFFSGVLLGNPELVSTDRFGNDSPGVVLGTDAALTSWTLDYADDGLPVEDYEVEIGDLVGP